MPTHLINGVELYYEITGNGDTVVLTHGSWGDGAGWQPTVDILRDRFRVITWDRRGHTRSDSGSGPGSVEEDVADLIALIQHVADEPVKAVGNSYGSVISLRLAVARPDLVQSVAVHEPAALQILRESPEPNVQNIARPFFAELEAVTALLEQGRNRDAPQHFIDEIIYGPGTWETFPEESKATLAANAPTFLDEMHDQPYGRLDLPALAASDVPMLISAGTESPEFLKMIVNLIGQAVPNIQVEWIEGTGHVPHGTHPEALVHTLTAFWDRISKS